MIISINGPAGSGKSSTAKRLAEALGWPHYYMGGLRREAARQRGLTLAEYNKLGESDPSTDNDVDDEVKRLGREKDDFIIESRTAWHFIPHSLKVYLDVNEQVAAERVWRDLQRDDARNEASDLHSVDDVLASHKQRRASDTERYRKYYGFDCYDQSHFDLVIDTSNQTIDETVEVMKKAVRERMNK
jgi:cytidylate kinase